MAPELTSIRHRLLIRNTMKATLIVGPSMRHLVLELTAFHNRWSSNSICNQTDVPARRQLMSKSYVLVTTPHPTSKRDSTGWCYGQETA
jgi:hypothetical protein